MIATSTADLLLFDDTLTCNDEFPTELRVGDSVHMSADATARAETVLRAMAALDEPSGDDTDGHAAVDLALARVEAKVDLALGLLAAIAARGTPMPSAAPVRWSRRGLVAAHATALDPQTRGMACLYLLPGMPLSLDLPVEVIACEPGADGARLWMRFCGDFGGLQAGIERQLFRRHRRLVAEIRRQR